MKPFHIPVVAIGPGSQPESEPVNYFEMPHDMHTYRPPVLPEPEEMAGRAEVKAVLEGILAGLVAGAGGVDLAGLAPEAVTLLGQVLGEGE
ncbi:MAG: hydrogenase expression/formation protein, partial [Thiobacillus sp.]|nr:hydrogenase expression/formation protein [Thiobacillus sp.]